MANKSFELHTDLSDSEFFTLLQAAGKYKERSDQTHDTVHAPLLLQQPGEPIECLLLGDSMLERLKTTGAHTEIAQCPFPQIFNAGVGGDRIQNVLYRLGTKDLFHALHVRGVKQAIIQMGTNDLRPKQGLTSDALWQYALVLEALHRAAPGVKILVTGLMPRKGAGQALIDQSNANLERLTRDFNQMIGRMSGKHRSSGPSASESCVIESSLLRDVIDTYFLFSPPH